MHGTQEWVEAEAALDAEARELVSWEAERRRKIARALRSVRSMMRSIMGAAVYYRRDYVWREWRELGGDLAIRVSTPRALRQEARKALRYSRERWHNPYSNEYYTACGYDDYMAEIRHGARRRAALLSRAARLLEEGRL